MGKMALGVVGPRDHDTNIAKNCEPLTPRRSGRLLGQWAAHDVGEPFPRYISETVCWHFFFVLSPANMSDGMPKSTRRGVLIALAPIPLSLSRTAPCQG